MSVQSWLQSKPADVTRPAKDVLIDMEAAGAPLVDSQRWTWAGLAKRFGQQAVGVIDETLRQVPGMDWVRLSLAGAGLDFSDAQTQAGLDGLIAAGVLSKEVGDGLKAVGIQPRTAWQQFAGDAALPTVEEIEAAQSVEAARTKSVDLYSVFSQGIGDKATPAMVAWVQERCLSAFLAVRDDGADETAVRAIFAE